MRIVFILDDDEDILFVLKFWFLKAGYDVHVFTNSTDMIQLLDTCIPDIMLLDINLYGEDGREVCIMLRKRYNYQKPILHISANRYLYDIASCVCADGFIAKPFNLEELTKVVDSYISK